VDGGPTGPPGKCRAARRPSPRLPVPHPRSGGDGEKNRLFVCQTETVFDDEGGGGGSSSIGRCPPAFGGSRVESTVDAATKRLNAESPFSSRTEGRSYSTTFNADTDAANR